MLLTNYTFVKRTMQTTHQTRSSERMRRRRSGGVRPHPSPLTARPLNPSSHQRPTEISIIVKFMPSYLFICV